ncbi:MAG TPA: hypothetical protein VL240_13150 [Candidatus Binatia bacterium]|nr:hypothetical protein [Candidatus Binatia bacterium]
MKSVFHGPIGSPDYVVLQKKNIEAVCSTEEEVREQIRRTVTARGFLVVI